MTKEDEIFDYIHEKYSEQLSVRNLFIEELESGFKIGYDALFASVENEIRSELSEV